MQMDTQKYSNSTVYIVIAFLAIFIIMPPLCRVLYKEEEEVVDDTPAQVESVSDGTLTCNRKYEKLKVEVTSIAKYENDTLVSNIITIKNPILSGEGLEENKTKEYNDYSQLLGSLLSVSDSNKKVDGDTITVTLDKDVMDGIEEDDSLSTHVQDAISLQNSYEINGFTCSIE